MVRAVRYWRGRPVLAVSLAWAALSCTGAAFTARSECEHDCGGAGGVTSAGAGRGGGDMPGGANPEGGSSEGGVADAGEGAAVEAGRNAGGGFGGGVGGGGGIGGGGGGALGIAGGGMTGIAGVLNRPFPATDVLDDFNRADAALSDGWIGGTDNYVVQGEQLSCVACSVSAQWSAAFATDQEVFATFAGFDPDAQEMNLVLRAQDSSCEQIEVLYSPAALDVRIAYCVDWAWTELEPIELVLEAGQQLGGRIHAGGALELFVDGQLIGTVDVSAYPHKIGRIGVSGITGDLGLVWDDFGGGKWK